MHFSASTAPKGRNWTSSKEVKIVDVGYLYLTEQEDSPGLNILFSKPSKHTGVHPSFLQCIKDMSLGYVCMYIKVLCTHIFFYSIDPLFLNGRDPIFFCRNLLVIYKRIHSDKNFSSHSHIPFFLFCSCFFTSLYYFKE